MILSSSPTAALHPGLFAKCQTDTPDHPEKIPETEKKAIQQMAVFSQSTRDTANEAQPMIL